MQEVLSKIPYSNKTLWDRIKDLFSRFVSQLNKELGTKVDNSILSEAVGNVLDLVTLQNKVAEKEENKLINVYSTNKNGFEKLSNLLTNPVTINVNGKQVTFKTVEHAYQAKKALFAGDRDVANKIYNAENGWAAQKLSRTINGLKSKEWDAISESVLEDIMTQYYNQDSSAKQLLLSTRNSELTHKSDRNLGKWGEVFPKILMKIRDSFNRSKEDNLIAPEELSSVEKQLLKSRKFNLLKTSTGQQVITLPMKPQSAYLEARREIIKLNKEYGEGSATISNRIVLDKGKEIQVEAVKINTNQNVFEVNDVNSFLEQLAPSERLLFRKLKLNHTIETKC